MRLAPRLADCTKARRQIETDFAETTSAVPRPRCWSKWVGSCFDNAAAEAFFSSLEWEVLSRNSFRATIHAQAVVIDCCYTFYNHQRRHSAADGLSPVNYEIRESKTKPEAA